MKTPRTARRPKKESYSTLARAVFEMEIDGMRQVMDRLGSDFDKAITILLECVASGHKIIATGVGKSGHIAEKIASTLTSTGCPSIYLNCVNAVHGDLGLVCDGDTVLLLSYSGETEEIVRILPCLTRPRVQVIGITGKPNSTLARSSHIHLNAAVPREACPLNLAPTSSTTAMLALGDALAMVLLEARGFKKEDFAKFHPGGSIGKELLLKVTDVMRSLNHCAIVPDSSTVQQAIEATITAKAGAALVTDKKGRLLGIFTQGDFVRQYQKNRDAGQLPVRSVMTRNPIVVRADKLAVEAVKIFEKHPIDDLVVVDHDGRVAGLVDAQDLARHKLV